MISFAITIFLSAFLLFQVQPLIGKIILPWFGGTPAVWTTCMLFFQSLLVIGYSYAHAITGWFTPRRQLLVNVGVIAASIALLPIMPDDHWKHASFATPTLRILLLLLVTVGGPYLLLASTGPLLQSWFSQVHRGRSPYWLYALSNAGSLLGLFSYPFLVEYALDLEAQVWTWSAVYVAYALLVSWCAHKLWRSSSQQPSTAETASHSDSIRGDQSIPRPSTARPGRASVLWWLCLSACGSVMLLATTNRMSQDVSSVPFLWVLPLGIYVTTFIVAFGNEAWCDRRWTSIAMIGAVVATVVITQDTGFLHLTAVIALYCYVLAASCMACHGELVRLRPSIDHLTTYYVIISVGGALGGILVTIVAPLVFDRYHEFNVGLVTCLAILLIFGRQEGWKLLSPVMRRRHQWRDAICAVAIAAVASLVIWTSSVMAEPAGTESLAHDRNFYGTLAVLRREVGRPDSCRVVMLHGNTVHGVQFEREDKRNTPTMYYSRDSGIGLVIEHHPKFKAADRPFRIGVVGLGAGTLSCYARQGDYLRYYEIDPLVIRLAEEHFTFQSDARSRGADVDVFVGDARIVMEEQLANGKPQQFDVLAIDAFTSNAIPLHLLTRECFQTYRQHLAEGGVLAVHISNRYLDLRPAVESMCRDGVEQSLLIRRPPVPKLLKQQREFASGSEWVILTANQELLSEPVIQEADQSPPGPRATTVLTDHRSSLFRLLRW